MLCNYVITDLICDILYSKVGEKSGVFRGEKHGLLGSIISLSLLLAQ